MCFYARHSKDQNIPSKYYELQVCLWTAHRLVSSSIQCHSSTLHHPPHQISNHFANCLCLDLGYLTQKQMQFEKHKNRDITTSFALHTCCIHILIFTRRTRFICCWYEIIIYIKAAAFIPIFRHNVRNVS